MKSKCLLLLAMALFAIQFSANGQQASIPRLYKQGKFVQLLVDNKPYLILCGESGNSSASDANYLNTVWPKNAIWRPGRRMNGDQDHQSRHVRIPAKEYSIQRVKLYEY